ncbi:PEP-CTERM sorting domain-containing protein [Persicirhabdus sediminis]|uniref:PEP-CTERM sorting domain-containing protein n=1 Tax=Persicirhabdus sediminis TaxID=454144 RepID=A0A8J7SLV6_9BACT|nr:PEP-CTERM sorting domain-containing protein [Persicirhabdus sediminis]MBK1792581.1 PEP-CTERM sorting domain-containing protein [Persicirhabdus sediminis]
MKYISKPVRTFSAFAASIVYLAGSANGALVLTFTEDFEGVNLVISGSVNLAATLGYDVTSVNSNELIDPSGGFILGGSSSPINSGSPYNSDSYSVSDAWMPFGTGSLSYASLGNGDRVALFSNGAIGLPTGYVSGESLSATNSWIGSTFDSLGLTQGSYTTTLTNVSISDTVTVNVGVVPEPSTALLIGIGILGTIVRRRPNYKK